jgi:methylglutaconyl-CoA hydratase
MSEHVLVEISDGVMWVTLNRPDKRNALSAEMIGMLAESIARAELESEVRVVALRGEGKDFCSGADLKELLESANKSIEDNEREALTLGEVFLAMRRLPKPVVALVHGRAVAGGAGLATACDLVVAAESASFGYPEIQRGFVPAMVMTLLLRSVGEKRAFDLVATGRLVSAGEALAMGLVSRVHPEGEFQAAGTKLITELSGHSTTALALTKQLFTDLGDRSFGEGVFLGARVNALSRSTEDFKTTIAGFLSK